MINQDKAISKRLVLGCGALVYDMVALIKHNDTLNKAIDLQCLPAKLHNRPQLIAPEVDKYLTEHGAKYNDIYVAYGDCGTAGELDKVLAKHNAQRLPGAHCYEFFAGSEEFEEIIEEELGTFFLTDYLVKFFDRLVIEGLGLDRYPELFDAYFKHYKKMMYLAQTDDPKLQEQAKAHAASFGLEYEFRLTGINGMSAIIDGIKVDDSGLANKQKQRDAVGKIEVELA